ncbi:hypothetical protein ACJRO7_033575 [Eucalyptus globulus]|uniref:Uncharacterized protein n=1 Tax=Eucalyptus globulus TaxID=34317 RepID=A0ABD3JPN7_EUCGL
MAAMQEAMKEKELVVKSQELLRHPPMHGRGRVKRLICACLFRCCKALVSKISGFLLHRTATYTPHHKSPLSSSPRPHDGFDG